MANGVYWLPTVVVVYELVGGGPWLTPWVRDDEVVLLAGSGVSPGMIAVDEAGVSPGMIVVDEAGMLAADEGGVSPPRLPPFAPEVCLGRLVAFVPLFPLLLWELLCCVPPTAPPTTPPIIRMMIMTIVVMPHLVRYHGAFFVMRLPFSNCPSLRAMATAPGL